jgi:hypothetical protein
MLDLQIAQSKDDKDTANKIVVDFHSYVASPKTVGRVIKYLIRLDGELVGTFWLGSGFKPTPKAILRHLGKSQSEFDAMFNSIADNKRFVLIKSIPNLGTQVLKQVRSRAKRDWLEIYGDDLLGIVTTIGAGKTGAVYAADNWKKIGETSGLPSARKSVSMKWNDSDEIAARFTKPTGENKKLIYFTDKI